MESQLRLTVVLGFWHSLYTLPEIIVPISGVHLSDTFRYFLLLVRRGSELFGVSVQTDSGIRILAFLIYLEVTVPISGVQKSQLRLIVCLFREVIVHLSDTFRYFLLLVRRGSELFGVSAQTDSGIRFLAFLIYPARSYCAYF